jgi:hypothetical protein
MKNLRIFMRRKDSLDLRLPILVTVTALLVTGCPHNQYVLELKPQGDRLDRTLVFYCEDDVNTNTGAPNYQPFGARKLAAITSLYSAQGLTTDGERHVAHGQFTNEMPNDVGGAGAYMNLTTSLGEAGFYVERFRGNDDLAGTIEQRLKVAEGVADLVVGWAQAELGQAKGYEKLRQFLEVDLRRDLMNLGTYWCEAQFAAIYTTNGYELFAVRFGQYLAERGYFKVADIPGLFRDISAEDSQALLSRIQRLVARKMGVLDTEPVPASLAFLGNSTTLDESLNKYLAGTDSYRAKLKKWEEEKKLKPAAAKPEPYQVMRDRLGDLVEFDLFGHSDHLTVHLSLPAAPVHSNGRWDPALKRVSWETEIEDGTNGFHVPFSCYAGWAQGNQEFQEKHFGKVALTGDELLDYGLWRTSQEAGRGAEWDAFLESLQPGSGLVKTLDAFRFSDEPNQVQKNQQPVTPSRSAFPRELIKGALR